MFVIAFKRLALLCSFALVAYVGIGAEHAYAQSAEAVASSLVSKEAKQQPGKLKQLFCRKGNLSGVFDDLKSFFSSKESEVPDNKKDPSKTVISVRAGNGMLGSNRLTAALGVAICTGPNPGGDPKGEEFARVQGGKVVGSKFYVKALESLRVPAADRTNPEAVKKIANDTLKEFAMQVKSVVFKLLCASPDTIPKGIQFLTKNCPQPEVEDAAPTEDTDFSDEPQVEE